MSNDIVIKFENICKSFDDNEVLRGFDLDIERGETIVVLGRSGCGKSVMLKILLGLIEPDSGMVTVDGTVMSELGESSQYAIRKKIGMLFQGSALFDSLTVGENVAYALVEHSKLRPDEIRNVVRENLEFVDLPDTQDLMPSELSGGMRKRVALARAIAYRPEIILYDEPTTGLDPMTATTINQLVRKTQRQYGVTSIVVTHELASAFSVADRLAVINDGRIIEIGSEKEVRQSHNRFVQTFLAGPK